MNLTRIIIAGAAIIAASLLLTACNSTITTLEPVVGADGKPLIDSNGNVVMKKTVTEKESPARHKTFSAAGSVTALDVETSASTDGSSSAMPHVLIGGSAVAVSSAAEEDNKPTMGYSWSSGIFKSITSAEATSGAITYTGIKNETAEQTQMRLKAMYDYQHGTISNSASPDSKSGEVSK